ncbi:thiamine pyrophosphate-dependent enzyme [Ruicaihuangia caeni]|uniref:thiamine pyrophosphate-dependent enzyme n=1 Tax=Ruicaihuangia caeni TaxID=3042517 RepID=UPI00338F79E8
MTARSHVGSAIVETLVAQSVRMVTCVPGESFLPVLDALRDHRDDVQLIVARHEASAGQAAVAHAMRTGRVGVCAVSRGPGALHAAIAVHTAQQDAVPLLLLVGQVPMADLGRGAFQEISCEAVFGSMSKWVTRIERPERAAETIARAVRIAEAGRPGPVVVELPEDVLYETVASVEENADAGGRASVSLDVAKLTALAPLAGELSSTTLERIREALSRSARPLVLLGRGGWGVEQHDGIRRFAERNTLPVAASFRCQDAIDNRSSSYVGHFGFGADPELVRMLAEADCVIAIGGHFGDVETDGYTRRIGAPDAEIIHLAASEEDLDRTVRPTAAELVASGAAVRALESLDLDGTERWAEWTSVGRAAYLAHSTPPASDRLGAMIAAASELLGDDAVICNGAGNYTGWLHRFYRYRNAGTQLAPANGAMAFGLPAGVAAAAAGCRDVVVFAGDGCFMMSAPELVTAASAGLRLVVVVINNNLFGTIRMHQDREFPQRDYGTELGNPDFVQLGHAHGFVSERVREVSEFEAALQAALGRAESTLIEIDAVGWPLTPAAAAGARSVSASE